MSRPRTRQHTPEITATKKQNKLHGLSPRANYTDRATAACRRSDCQLVRIKGNNSYRNIKSDSEYTSYNGAFHEWSVITAVDTGKEHLTKSLLLTLLYSQRKNERKEAATAAKTSTIITTIIQINPVLHYLFAE
jgi:hypothetical protein